MSKNASFKPAPSGVNLGDVVYVLFKHKWKIALVSLLAFGAAVAYYLKAGAPFQSDAKLMVRYIVERNSLDRIDSTTNSTGRQMDSVIKEEMEIFTSRDLAEKVVEELVATRAAAPSARGTEKPPAGEITETDGSPQNKEEAGLTYSQLIGPDFEGPPTKAAAVTALQNSLMVTADAGSSVINVTFSHSDPTLPRRILEVFVRLYLSKHLEIHRSTDSQQMADDAKAKAFTDANTARENLKRLLLKHSIVSLQDGIDRFKMEVTAAQNELNKAEAELEGQKIKVEELRNKIVGPALDASPVASDANNAVPGADAATFDSYRELCGSLDRLRASRDALLLKRTPESAEMRGLQSQIDNLLSQRRAMEKSHPDLVAAATAGATAAIPVFDLPTEEANCAALVARVAKLKTDYSNAKTRADDFAKDSQEISAAQKNLETADESLKYFVTSSQKAQVDSLLKADNIPNISKLQAPTPPLKNTKKRNQLLIGMVVGGPVLGIGFVLLFGVFLDRTIKRPLELEERMNLPLMLSIPYFSRRQRLKASRPMGASGTTSRLKDSEEDKSPWDQNHFVHPFAEALRDRLVNYFEATGNARKPKLIAVTGYTVGAGTSTIAGGLAASLSEIGDGKVLLVDMSGNRGAAHPFFDGRPALSLTKALRRPLERGIHLPEQPEQDEDRMENLFLARADSPSAGAATIGLRRMLPELKSSDFDYIIFDMPPLGQTKPTASMAGLMDKVIVIVEAEANSRSEVRRGYRDLTEAGADISMVFNKTRFHGPKALIGSIA